MKFVLEPYPRNTSDEDLINDLKRVAKELNKEDDNQTVDEIFQGIIKIFLMRFQLINIKQEEILIGV
jgi:hypothetical protein